jgi:outer membrane protein assembly factor BamB
VADGDRVYTTLQFLDAPVSVLDAATGEVRAEALEGTRGADEILLADGVLVVKATKERSVGATVRFGKDALDDTLLAVDASTGRMLWRHEGVRVVPYALAAQGGRVVYHDMDDLVCLDARTGRGVWRTPNPIRTTVGGGSTLVLHDGVVLFHGNTQPPAGAAKGKNNLYLTALALDDGKVLWRQPGSRGQAGACTQPTDLFVAAGNLVWLDGSLQGRDLRTGEVRKTVAIGHLISPGHHYRCHRSKATERFLIWPKRGAEFVDTVGDGHMRHDWLRAPCFTGLVPANGLLYVPPSQCFCYPGAKVSGYLALAAEGEASPVAPVADGERLVRGPAYGVSGNRKSAIGNPQSQITSAEAPARNTTSEGRTAADWPMYRHDVQRSGSTAAAVPADLAQRWAAPLTAPVTPPVIAGGRVLVAEKDAHRVRCLDASDGRTVWTFTAGGRIDSPPTVHEGLVLFGCRDGRVYALRAADGALAWRFLAAAADRRTVAFEQVESLWPVHGSVLVQDGVAYAAAGRSSFLDGGIRVWGLDAATGRPLYRHDLVGPWPDVATDVGRPFAMEGALPDLLVSDGKDLYMGRIKFDARLARLPVKRESDLGELDMGAVHLVPTGGFLDDTGFDRLYWMVSRRWPGFYFAQHAPKSGQLVVFDESNTYAVKYFYRRIQWSPIFYPAEQGYLLFADENTNEPDLAAKGEKPEGLRWLPEAAYSDKHRRGGRGVEKGTGYIRRRPPLWQTMVPVRVRAMVLAGDRLLVAGPPDAVDPQDPYAAFEGRGRGVLKVVAAADGSVVAERGLASPPAFDGMAAAGGRLYVTLADGTVLCLGGK